MNGSTEIGTITCPVCDAKSEESIPHNACVRFFNCPECGTRLQPEAGDCCVFCSYGDRPCRPKRDEELRKAAAEG